MSAPVHSRLLNWRTAALLPDGYFKTVSQDKDKDQINTLKLLVAFKTRVTNSNYKSQYPDGGLH